MGALLLIVVVVIAVATLASFVSVAETNANNRSSLLTSLKNENLQVVNAAFQPTSSNPMQWNNLNLTIRNSNTEQSGLSQIEISNSTSNYWVPSWYIINSTDQLGMKYSPILGQYLTFPPKATISVYLNLTNAASTLAFLRTSSITITLLTKAGNFFYAVYDPPTAEAQVGISSISYQHFNRDVVSLDGSESLTSNTTKITSYFWTVEVPLVNLTYSALDCTPAEFSNPGNYTAVTFSGETTQFLQEAFSNLLPPANYCLTGPFRVSLQVTNSENFISTSLPVIISEDSSMAPTATVAANTNGSNCSSPGTITATVNDIFGRPVPNATVLAAVSGSFTPPLNSTYSTKANGEVIIHLDSCVAPSTVTFAVDSLPPATITYTS